MMIWGNTMLGRGLLILTFIFISACSHKAPVRDNRRSVKTSFIVVADGSDKRTFNVQKNERFLSRDVRPSSVAVLEQDFIYVTDKRTKIIPKGTYLFESVGKILTKEDVTALKSIFSPSNNPVSNTPLTLGDNDQDEGINRSTSYSSTPFEQLARQKRKLPTYSVYCGLMSAKLDGGDAMAAIFTLGISLATKDKDVFCLQDKNNDGQFETQWESQLTFNYPPTVDSIYNDKTTQPVTYHTVKGAEVEPIGQLWLQVESVGTFYPSLVVKGKIGKGVKSVEFNNLSKTLDKDNILLTRVPFFGAHYSIKEAEDGSGFEVSVTPAEGDQVVSLSKTISYTRSTRYIPIYVP